MSNNAPEQLIVFLADNNYRQSYPKPSFASLFCGSEFYVWIRILWVMAKQFNFPAPRPTGRIVKPSRNMAQDINGSHGQRKARQLVRGINPAAGKIHVATKRMLIVPKVVKKSVLSMLTGQRCDQQVPHNRATSKHVPDVPCLDISHSVIGNALLVPTDYISEPSV